MSVTLIGMPGVGKSTIAAELQKLAGFDVVELDKVIEENEGVTLTEIIASRSETEFKKIEAAAVRSIKMTPDAARVPRVISTGGSVVYDQDGMAHLRSGGPAANLVVHLEVDYATLFERTEGFSNRGVVFNGKTCEELFVERAALYEQYRHVVVDCCGKTAHEIAVEVLRLMQSVRIAAANPIKAPVLLGNAATCAASAKERDLPVRFLSDPVLSA